MMTVPICTTKGAGHEHIAGTTRDHCGLLFAATQPGRNMKQT
jgi:hypothetical protein